MKVAVLGSGGFIGSALTRQLLDAGHEVVGLVRSPEKAEAVRRSGAVVVPGDIRDPGVVRRAIDGAEAVAHLALPRAGEGSPKEASDTCRRGTPAVLEACRDADLRSFVLASGAMGMYRHGPGEWIDESFPEEPRFPSLLERLDVDRAIRSAHREWGLPASILRPPIVYGNGGGFRDFFLDFLRRGLFRVPGDGSYLVNLVHVDDCATAYRLALERPGRGETFLVSDGEPVTMRALADFLASRMGKRPPGTVPPFLARLVAGRDLIGVLSESARLRNARLKESLGWRPRYPSHRDGIPGVVEAFLRIGG